MTAKLLALASTADSFDASAALDVAAKTLTLLVLVAGLVALVALLERTHRRAATWPRTNAGPGLWSQADDRDLARTVQDLGAIAAGGGAAGRAGVGAEVSTGVPQDAPRAGLGSGRLPRDHRRTGPQDARPARCDGLPALGHRPRPL